MNILMISLGTAMVESPDGNAVGRHLQYAHHVDGVIDIVLMVPRRETFPVRRYEDRLRIVPVCSHRPWGLVFGAIRAAEALAREKQYDLIYTQDPFGTALVGLWLRHRFGYPLVIGNHSSFLENERWVKERPLYFSLLHRIGKWTLPKAEAWRVSNRYEREKYRRSLNIDLQRVIVINAPVPIDQFKRKMTEEELEKLRGELDIVSGAPVAIWVGRPVKVKRLPVLFAAFRRAKNRVKDARLVLVGNFSLTREDLVKELCENGLDDGSVIQISGGVAHKDLWKYYQMSDVYVHSSSYEGFGRVLVEAAAAGLPAVSTDTDGAREIVIDGETGRLVSVENASALGDALAELLNDKEKAASMGEAARQWVQRRFDEAQNIERRARFWRTVAQAGRGGRAVVADDLNSADEKHETAGF